MKSNDEIRLKGMLWLRRWSSSSLNIGLAEGKKKKAERILQTDCQMEMYDSNNNSNHHQHYDNNCVLVSVPRALQAVCVSPSFSLTLLVFLLSFHSGCSLLDDQRPLNIFVVCLAQMLIWIGASSGAAFCIIAHLCPPTYTDL